MTKKSEADKAVERKVKDTELKLVKRALRLERTGLLAIAKVFIQEVPDPERLLLRLDGLVRAAQEKEYTKPETRAVLIAGRDLITRAIEQELAKPQGLFNPDVGHIQPRAVDRIVNSEAPPRLLEDKDVFKERNEFNRNVENEIMRLLREKGGMTDEEILHHYTLAGVGPKIGRHDIYYRRSNLVLKGLIMDNGERRPSWGKDKPAYDLAERVILKKQQANQPKEKSA